MSSASMALPLSARTPADADGAEFVSLAEASRTCGLHPTTIQKLALTGRIRVRNRGLRTVYSREDARQFAR